MRSTETWCGKAARLPIGTKHQAPDASFSFMTGECVNNFGMKPARKDSQQGQKARSSYSRSLKLALASKGRERGEQHTGDIFGKIYTPTGFTATSGLADVSRVN